MPLVVGDARRRCAICEKALERGVFAQPLLPPQVPLDGAGLRLAVMASHSKSELRDAARALAQAAKAAGAVQAEPRRAPQPVAVREPAPIAPGPRARHAELWDDGEGELWVEQRRPVRAAPAVQASGRPFDAELDGPPAPRASRRSQQMAQGIFDVEAPASVVEHAA